MGRSITLAMAGFPDAILNFNKLSADIAHVYVHMYPRSYFNTRIADAQLTSYRRMTTLSRQVISATGLKLRVFSRRETIDK